MPLSVRLVSSCRTSHPTTNFHPLLHSRQIFRKNERYLNGFSGPSPSQIGPQDEVTSSSAADERLPLTSKWSPTFFKMFESAATTFASILVLA